MVLLENWPALENHETKQGALNKKDRIKRISTPSLTSDNVCYVRFMFLFSIEFKTIAGPLPLSNSSNGLWPNRKRRLGTDWKTLRHIFWLVIQNTRGHRSITAAKRRLLTKITTG